VNAAAERLEFAPPPQPGLARGLGIAILAHLLLLAALTWGVKWKREAQDAAAEAELWAAVPQQAAPAEVVKAPPAPVPPPPVVREEPKPEPKPRDADIAAEKEKQRKKQDAERREAEQDRKEREQKKREQEQKAKEKAAEERKREDAQKALKEKQEQAQAAKRREDNLRRMQAMAGGPVTGAATNAGAGMSKSYAVRLASLFKRNMRFPGGVDSITGNPQAEVRVRVGPGGTILNVRVTKPSGNPAWDAAVVRAIESTERIPADENGKYATDFPLDWGPRD
jgi:colicin import membrane protein